MVSVQDYENRRVRYEYTPEGYLWRVTDPEGNVTTYSYDANGRTIAIHDPAGRYTYTTYDQDGNVKSVVDKNGDGHFFEYNYDKYKKQYYVKMKSLSGVIKETWYDKDGDVIRIDVNGKTVERKSKIGFPTSSKETISLECINEVYHASTFIQPSSQQSTVRMVKKWDEKGNLTVKYLDNRFNVTKIVYPDGSTYQFEYETAYNNMTKKIEPRGIVTLYEYEYRGNLIKITEAAGTEEERILTYTYDQFGQLLTATI
ncbi:MAG TPA: hypothetical protein ENI41_08595, partial [Deltaproteobacteria bacterium]|nr:hypothetical protein [Deltaproteobacteria bacterium]